MINRKLANRWKTLSHNGVYFSEPYEPLPSSIKLLYNGNPVELTLEEEEPATWFAKYLQTDYIKNRTFLNNFWKDWKKILKSNHVIQKLEDCDFKQIHKYFEMIKERKKQLSKEEKQAIKTKRDSEMEKYKFCIVDGTQQPIDNYIVEPPGLFIGRGTHPYLGKFKKRILPKDVTINIGREAPIPKPNIEGTYGQVIHDRKSVWIASWKNNITNKYKYVFMGTASTLRGENDKEKFELARKLKKKIKTIRKQYYNDMQSKDKTKQQLATALYFIDNYALRVGNEKGDDEADTVGVTSLRVEHIKLLPKRGIQLDFLGKDSIRYQRSFTVDNNVYENLKQFIQVKDPTNDLFDLINSRILNDYLQTFMKNLTAKVFRTYNSSYLFQKRLLKIADGLEVKEIMKHYNEANRAVAILCNHQKKVSNSFCEQMKTINDKIKQYKSELKKANTSEKKKKSLRNKIKLLQEKKKSKKELKDIALGTSKANYIDPRITIAFAKKHNVPFEKFFTSSNLKKFQWAMSIDENFKF